MYAINMFFGVFSIQFIRKQKTMLKIKTDKFANTLAHPNPFKPSSTRKNSVKLPSIGKEIPRSSQENHHLLQFTQRIVTQRTQVRPWAAHSIDLNKETIKPDQKISAMIKNDRAQLTDRKKQLQRQLQSTEVQLALMTTHRPRQRAYSCKTAVVKGFPMFKPSLPVVEIQKEKQIEIQALSTISRNQMEESFISMSGFVQLALE